jgi:acyl carrier protein
MEIKNKDFHGHQIGLCIGIKDTKTNTVKQNNIPDDDFNIKFDKMLEDKELLLLQDSITQVEDGELKERHIYYLPYYVVEHSAYKPTINFEQISSYAYNVTNTVKIEVLFVEDDYNRYVTFEMNTNGSLGGRSLTLMDFISGLEDEIEKKTSKGEDFKCASDEDTEYTEGDTLLDMYDRVGNKVTIVYPDPSGFLDLVSSIRIIGLDVKIN